MFLRSGGTNTTMSSPFSIPPRFRRRCHVMHGLKCILPARKHPLPSRRTPGIWVSVVLRSYRASILSVESQTPQGVDNASFYRCGGIRRARSTLQARNDRTIGPFGPVSGDICLTSTRLWRFVQPFDERSSRKHPHSSGFQAHSAG